MKYRTRLAYGVCLGLLSELPGAAMAQVTNAGDESQAKSAGAAPETDRPTNLPPDRLEAIVVTARRQQEALLDVPLTVTALTSKKLDALGLREFRDIANFTPSLVFNSDFGGRTGSRIVIRGMTPSVSPTASVFIDGVPVASNVVEGVDDAARVEVLKGPQTAYFGRSTFAGAINFVTKTPDMQELHGRAEATIGTDSLYDLRGQVETPLIKDKLSVRIGGRFLSRNGTYTNVADGSHFNNQRTKLATMALRAEPTPDLSINLYGFIQRDDDGPSTYRIITRPNFNCNAGANPGGAPNYICGVIPSTGALPLGQNVSPSDISYFLGVINRDFYGSAASPVSRLLKEQPLTKAGLIGKTYHAHGAIEYDADFLKLSVLGGYNLTKHFVLLDQDYLDSRNIPNPNPPTSLQPGAPAFNNTLVRREDYYTNWFTEGRIATDTSKSIHGFIGVSYNHQILANLVTVQLASGNVITGGLGAINRTRTPAVFGNITWDISPEITLSAEGRYQVDKLDTFRRSRFTDTSGPVLVNNVLSPTKIVGASFRTFTPRFLAQYRPIQDTMIFASYSKGVNPGSFNTSVLNFTPDFQARLAAQTGAGLTVQPEKLDNYEVGVKSQFWDRRAQVTLSFYHSVWSNQIVNVTYQDPSPPAGTGQGATVNVNIGKTVLKGFELEGTVRPIDELELSGTLAYNGSDIRQYVCVACRGYAGANVSVIGNSLFLAPRWSATAAAQWTQPIGPDLNAFLRTDFFYKGSKYADETNLARTRAQYVFNFRLGVSNPAYRVEGFVTNAFNNRAPFSVGRANDPITGAYEFQLGLPELRRFGLRVSYNL